MFEQLRSMGFPIAAENHGETILYHACGDAASEIEDALQNLSIPISEILGSGGGLSDFTQRLRDSLYNHGWPKKNYQIAKVVTEGVEPPAIERSNTNKVCITSDNPILQIDDAQTHEIDHVKKVGEETIALEIEWNNKDTFFARDLSSFRQLYESKLITLGVIITRSDELQEFFEPAVKSYAQSNAIHSVEDLARHGIRPTPKQINAINSRIGKSRNNPSEATWTFEASWAKTFVDSKYSRSHTYWSKLMENIKKGHAYPCPIVSIGLPASIVDESL